MNEKEITENLSTLLEDEKIETEKTLEIVYQPQAVFKVRAVTRCTSTIPGNQTLFSFLVFMFKFPPIAREPIH